MLIIRYGAYFWGDNLRTAFDLKNHCAPTRPLARVKALHVGRATFPGQTQLPRSNAPAERDVVGQERGQGVHTEWYVADQPVPLPDSKRVANPVSWAPALDFDDPDR